MEHKNLQAGLIFFEKNYDRIDKINHDPTKKIYIGDNSKLFCRFCHKGKEHTLFRMRGRRISAGAGLENVWGNY